MQSKLTNLKDATSLFRKELTPYYPDGELKAIGRVFWEDVFGLSPADLIVKENLELNTKQQLAIITSIERLQKYEPIQHVTGFTWFYDMKIEVSEDVLIPRPETEDLINEAVRIYTNTCPTNILDIGTGSGCIALALKQQFKNATVQAVDVSEKALAIARKNADKLKLQVDFRRIDVLNTSETKTLGMYDLICSNPPYIANAEKTNMETNVLDYEPHLALFVPDSDPLVFYRVIAEFGLSHLNDKGTILCEINEFLADDTQQLFRNAGYNKVSIIDDMFGKPRIVNAQP